MTDPYVSRDLREISTGTRIFSGAILHADLVGFTGLAERLGSHGRPGTEQLTGILNSSLDAILRPIQAADGVVLYFAGDSVTARLPDSESASACAAEIHCNLKGLGPVRTLEGEIRPRATVSIGIGRWGETVLSSGGSSHLLLSGPLVSRLADLERQPAGPDGTTRVRLFIPPVISGPTCAPPGEKSQESPEEPPGAAEHRTMAAMFVRLFGYDPAKPPIDELQSMYGLLRDVADRFSGSLHLVDSIVRDGCRLFLLFGAPRATGRDARNAVLAAREASAALGAARDIGVATGLGYGYAYSGVVGNSWRRQYTVIGDSVNTAARLADTASGGCVVVSEDVRRAAVGELAFEELPPVMAKGKSEAVRRFTPSDEAKTDLHSYGFVGRKRELSKLVEALSSSGVLVDLTGEAGIGKTRVLDELSEHLEDAGRRVIRFRPGEPRGVDDHLAALLARLCGIAADESAAKTRKRLTEALHSAGGERLSNLASIPGSMLLGLKYPDSPYTDLTPELRRVNLMDCLKALILNGAGKSVLVLDDGHLLAKAEMDELSTLVSEALSSADCGLSAVFSRRPGGPTPLAGPGVTIREMELTGLDDRARRKLIRGPLDGARLSPEVEAAVLKRAQGNPFYLVQIVLYMAEKGLLLREGDTWVPSSTYSSDSLPDNVFSMIMARIDRLEELARECLRIASVIGMEFSVELVGAVARRKATGSLKEAASAGLVYAESIRQLEYVFSHMLIRDVAYGSMLRERRRELHGQVASLLEGLAAPSAVLAYHCELAEDWEDALRHSMAAGERAREEYRNTRALEHFKKAEELARLLDDRPDALAKAWKSIADVLETVGDYDEAAVYCRKVTELLDPEDLWASAMQSLAQIHFIRGDFDLAMEVIGRAETRLEECGATSNRFRVRIPCFKAWVCGVRGEVERAMEYAEDGVEIARSLPDSYPEHRHVLGHSYNTLATVYWARGEMDSSAEYFGRALEIAEELGSRREIAVTLGNLGLVYAKLGSFEKAIEAITQKLATGREIGEKYMVNSCHGELVPCMVRAGRMHQGRTHCEEYIRLSRELGSTHDLLIGLAQRVLLAIQSGELEDIDATLDEMERTATDKGFQRELSSALMYRGWVGLLRGCPQDAESCLRRSYEEINTGDWIPKAKALHARAIAEAGGDPQPVVEAAEREAEDTGELPLADTLFQTGAAMAALKSYDEARGRFERALSIYSEFSALLDMAESHLALGKLPGLSQQESRTHLAAAAELFEGAGLLRRAAECQTI